MQRLQEIMLYFCVDIVILAKFVVYLCKLVFMALKIVDFFAF